MPGPLMFPSHSYGVNMRKPAGASVVARKESMPTGRRGDAPVELVCLALTLALLALAFRIASVW
jgi:hypothetical protein